MDWRGLHALCLGGYRFCTGPSTDEGERHADVYDRVVVNDREVVEVELTDDAKRHGLAWTLPARVKVVMARPAGARHMQTTIVRVPIHGKAEWEASTRKQSAS